MRPTKKRELVSYVQGEHGLAITRSCILIELQRSVFYYRSNKRDDSVLRMRIREIAESRVRYGVNRIVVLLRREGWPDNHKRIYRIYKEEGLNLRSKRPKRSRSAIHRQSSDGNSSSLHECWSMDFVADQLFNGRKFRALTVVDNYSRTCLEIHPQQSIKETVVVSILNQIKAQ